MTLCVAMNLEAGMVFVSDTRTNPPWLCDGAGSIAARPQGKRKHAKADRPGS